MRAEFLAHDTSVARRALKRWALAVGHRRVWFADEIFEPGDLLPLRRVAHTKCRTCGMEMADSSDDFWDVVADSGFFPSVCFACGASVAQWTTAVPRELPGTGRRQQGVRLSARETTAERHRRGQ